MRDTVMPTKYARFFDASSSGWIKDQDYNTLFLKAQENYWNYVLKVRGHVFLNEVYDSLGMSRSNEGAVTGWTNEQTTSDNFINFKILEKHEQGFLLDFNANLIDVSVLINGVKNPNSPK